MKTYSVRYMTSIFENCKSLISLDLSNFETYSTIDMSNMFNNCSSLETLKINFDTEKVTKMSYMFASCVSLTSLNISSFNTQNVKNFIDMFEEDAYLELYLYSNKCHNLIDYLPDYVILHDLSK